MHLANHTTVVVADGAKALVFRADGHGALTVQPLPPLSSDNKSSGQRRPSTPANPDESRLEEDSFSFALVDWLNGQAMAGKLEDVVVVAAPKALGEMRKHYNKTLGAKIVKELAKDLVNHSTSEIASAIEAI